jgi:hypothetical protein
VASRGALYIVWGDEAAALAERSIASLRRFHPDLPVHVETLPANTDPVAGLARKAEMFALSPFETTAFLDADTVILGPLDHAFVQAERFGLACSICECPWARRFAGVSGDTVEYNTGVLFFTHQANAVFTLWEELAGTVDATTRWQDAGGVVRGMDFNDQASFALAIERSGLNPFVLPYNWNFRPDWHRSAFAPVRIWHDRRPVPSALVEANRVAEEGYVRFLEFGPRR